LDHRVVHSFPTRRSSDLGGYYTIVIHSLRTRELAEELAQKVDGPSFRINIKQVTIDGTTYFRVSIGQFKTNAAARDAISKLPERSEEHTSELQSRFDLVC